MADEVSSLDFSERSNESLEEALLSINQHKYPANYRALVAEIGKRKAEGRWVARLMADPPVEIGNRVYAVRERPEGLEIEIREGSDGFALVFISVWLAGWVVAEAFLVSSLVRGAPVHWKGGGVMTSAELGGFLVFWSCAGIVCFFSFLWMLMGKEIVKVSREGVELRHEMGVSVRHWFVPAAEIRGFRQAYVWRRQRRNFYGLYVALQLLGDFPRTFAMKIREDGAADLLRRLEAFGRSAGYSWKTEETFREP
jgi:hypothetical protein